MGELFQSLFHLSKLNNNLPTKAGFYAAASFQPKENGKKCVLQVLSEQKSTIFRAKGSQNYSETSHYELLEQVLLYLSRITGIMLKKPLLLPPLGTQQRPPQTPCSRPLRVPTKLYTNASNKNTQEKSRVPPFRGQIDKAKDLLINMMHADLDRDSYPRVDVCGDL